MAISRKIEGFMSKASWIRRMFEQGNQLRALHGPENVYDFTLGNPTTEPPQAFRDALRELCSQPQPGMHRYMPNAGYPWVRERVASALAADTGVPLRGEHVLMATGAACGINCALRALLEPEDEVLIQAPYFPEYFFYVDNHGGTARIVETDDAFLPDLQAIDAAINVRTKVLILNSPNNPTGVIYPRALLEGLSELLQRAERRIGHAIYVISDEPYRKIAYGEEVVSPLAVIPNSLLCMSHSKDLAIPGERIGCIAVHPDAEDAAALMAAMTFTIRTLGFVNAPALMQRAVADLQTMTVDVQGYRHKRDLLLGGLRDAGYECIEPQGAFYLFPRCPLEDDVAFIHRLLDQRILAVPGSGFGRSGYFRLSYCVEAQTIERALPGLAKALQDCRSR